LAFSFSISLSRVFVQCLLCALSSCAFSSGFRGEFVVANGVDILCVGVCVSVRKRAHCQVFQFLILQGFVLSGKSLESTYQ
jgi:hypothetical protein